jgi:hypothetical protein
MYKAHTQRLRRLQNSTKPMFPIYRKKCAWLNLTVFPNWKRKSFPDWGHFVFPDWLPLFSWLVLLVFLTGLDSFPDWVGYVFLTGFPWFPDWCFPDWGVCFPDSRFVPLN